MSEISQYLTKSIDGKFYPYTRSRRTTRSLSRNKINVTYEIFKARQIKKKITKFCRKFAKIPVRRVLATRKLKKNKYLKSVHFCVSSIVADPADPMVKDPVGRSCPERAHEGIGKE